MPLRRSFAIILLAGVGCSGEVVLTLPEDSNARTAIVASSAAAYVVDLTNDDVPLRLDVDNGETLGLAFYDVSFVELGLVDGPIDPRDQGRGIPRGTSSMYTTEVVSEASRWVPAEMIPSVLDAVVLGPFDVGICAEVGACWREGVPRCKADCPTFDVVSPEAPAIRCPPGWTPTPWDRGSRFCEPPVSDDPTCPAGQRETFEGDCVVVGRACDADGWPVDLSMDGRSVIYVRDGARGGMGTRASPYARVSAAVAAATPGTTIALAAGRHGAIGIRQDDIWIRGCASTTVVASTTASVAAVTLHAAGTLLSDLRLEATGIAVDLRTTAANSLIQGVTITAGSRGIMARGSAIVRDAHVTAGDDGIIGARDLEVTDSMIVGGGRSLDCISGTSSVARVVIEDSTDTAVASRTGCVSEVSSIRVERPRVVAFAATEPGSELVVRDSYARDLGNVDDNTNGHGLLVHQASMRVQRVYITNARGAAVVVTEGANLDGADLFIRDVDKKDRDEAVGVLVIDGNAHLDRFATDGMLHKGVSVREFGALELSDAYVFVRQTGGSGIDAAPGGVVTLQRIVVDGAFLVGVEIDDGASIVSFDSVDVIGPQLVGVTVAPPIAATIRRVRVRGGSEVGFKARTFLNDSDQLVVEHLDVTCTDPAATGIQALFASALSIENFAARGCAVGLDLGTPLFGAFRRGAMVDNEDAVVVENESDLLSATHDLTFERNVRRFSVRQL